MHADAMRIDEILTPSRTLVGAQAPNKKRALELAANFIAGDDPTLDAGELFASLTARERLGSTGLGHGVAIPHCRLKQCRQVIGTLIRLADPIEFDAIDNQPVDLMFVLLVPTEASQEHLDTLALLAERFDRVSFRDRLRTAETSQDLYLAAVERSLL